MKFLAALLVAAFILPTNLELAAQESSRLKRYNAIASQLNAFFESRNERHPVRLVLGEESPKLFGFLETRDESGRRIVEPSADLAFQDCTRDAKLSAGISGLGSLQADPVGVTAGMSAAVARYKLIDIPKCHSDFQTRLFDALQLSIVNGRVTGLALQIGEFTHNLSGTQDQLLQLGAYFEAEQIRIRADFKKEIASILEGQLSKDEIEEIASKQISSLSAKLNKYLREQADYQRRQKQISDIKLTEEGLQSFVLIAFQHDPKLARDISIGVSGVSNIAQTALKLADETDPLRSAALSFNVVGIAFSLFNAFGDKGPTYDEIILEEVRALSDSLSEVREEMHGRFDHLETMLIALSENLSNRLVIIDDKLSELIKLYRESNERDALQEEIIAASIEYLLRGPSERSYEKCLGGVAGIALNLKDFGDCLVEMKAYAIDVAKLDLITGSSRIGADVLGPVTSDLLISIDGTRSLGYLRSVFEELRDEGEPAIPAIASPREWSRGVDAFVTLIDRSSELENVAKKLDRGRILKLEKRKVEGLIDEGEAIRSAVNRLRNEGPEKLLTLYQAESRALAEVIAEITKEEMARLPLMVTRERRDKHVEVRNHNGHSSMPMGIYTFYRYIEISEGALAGQRREAYMRGTTTRGPTFTTGDNDSQVRDGFRNALSYLTEANASMNNVGNIDEIRNTLRLEYLNLERVGGFPPTAKALIRPTVRKALNSAAVATKLERVRLLKHILMHHVMLGRDDELDRIDEALFAAIAELPDQPDRLMAALNDDFLPGDVKLDQAVIAWITEALSRRAAAVETTRSYLSGLAQVGFVDHYLARLRQLSAETRP